MQHRIPPSFLSTAATLFMVVGLFIGAMPIQAQNTLSWSERIQRALGWLIRAEPRQIEQSSNNREAGGSSRDRCPPTNSVLTALIPFGPGGIPEGKTLSAHPTLWFYIPYAEEFPEQTDRRLELVLIDQGEKILYQNTFLLPQQSGIVGVSLPSDQTGLEVNQRYRWVFSVICNPNNRSGDATVNGWIERVQVSSNLQKQLEQESDRDRLEDYAAQGLWYETIGTVMQLRQSSHSEPDVEEVWKGLLEAIGLPELAIQPLVPAAECAICRGESDSK